MSGHCKDSLSHPQPGNLPDIDLEAEINACVVKAGKDSRHTTTINNQRTGSIHLVDICVKSRYKGVILNGDPTATEYRHCIPMLRSGKKFADKFPVTVNSAKSIPNDEISTTIVLYDDSEVNGTIYGNSEHAWLVFTIDIN
jgi:hypothetical protein